jgi:hypothetical protein
VYENLTRNACDCGTKPGQFIVESEGGSVRRCPTCLKKWYINGCHHCGASIFMPYVDVGVDNTRCEKCKWFKCPRCGACQCTFPGDDRPPFQPLPPGTPVVIIVGEGFDPHDWD